MDEIKQMKYMIFDRAMYYKDVADYMDNLGKDNLKQKALTHREAIVGLITSLGLTEEYKKWTETGEL